MGVKLNFERLLPLIDLKFAKDEVELSKKLGFGKEYIKSGPTEKVDNAPKKGACCNIFWEKSIGEWENY